MFMDELESHDIDCALDSRRRIVRGAGTATLPRGSVKSAPKDSRSKGTVSQSPLNPVDQRKELSDMKFRHAQ